MAGSPTSDERFRRLYNEHFEAIRAYCARRLPAADANDAVSEVFLTVWRKADSLPNENLRPVLFGIARNTILHAKRSGARRSRIRAKLAGLAEHRPAGPEVEIVDRAENRMLLEALNDLPELDREVLRLRAWEELTAAEIAAVIDASVAATEKRISRAYKKLERALRRSAPDLTETHSPRGGER